MPRAFFRRLARKHQRHEQPWYLRPFGPRLKDRRLTGIARRSVAPALAIGLFVAWLPVLGHLAIAALLAVAFRANIIIAAVTTFVSNPLTIGPMVYVNYRVGEAILQTGSRGMNFEPTLAWFADEFLRVWQPLVFGSLIMATACAAVGYVAVNVIWRASMAAALKARRLPRRH